MRISMKSGLKLFVLILLLCGAVLADTKVVNMSCTDAIAKAQVLAAKHRWSTMRPDPTAPTLNIQTTTNWWVSGGAFSHPKSGTIVFEKVQGNDSQCNLAASGKPATTVLKEFDKK